MIKYNYSRILRIKNILDWWQNDNDKITIKNDNDKTTMTKWQWQRQDDKDKMTITKWQWQCAKWLNWNKQWSIDDKNDYDKMRKKKSKRQNEKKIICNDRIKTNSGGQIDASVLEKYTTTICSTSVLWFLLVSGSFIVNRRAYGHLDEGTYRQTWTDGQRLL